jgi:hypothetical protein
MAVILQRSTQQVRTTGLNQTPLGHLEWLEALHPEDSKSTMRTMKEAVQTGSFFVAANRIPRFGKSDLDRKASPTFAINNRRACDRSRSAGQHEP